MTDYYIAHVKDGAVQVDTLRVVASEGPCLMFDKGSHGLRRWNTAHRTEVSLSPLGALADLAARCEAEEAAASNEHIDAVTRTLIAAKALKKAKKQ